MINGRGEGEGVAGIGRVVPHRRARARREVLFGPEGRRPTTPRSRRCAGAGESVI